MRVSMVFVCLSSLCAAVAAQAKVQQKDIAVVEDTDGKINEQVFAPDSYLAAATCKFYQSGFPDAFDAVFVFTTYPLSFLTNVQQGWPVKQDQKGIGRTMYNMGPKFCSKKSRLRQAVKMGDVAILPDDPDKLYTGILMYSLTGIELMGHEFGHHWLASVRFDKGDGVKHCLLRGYEPSSEVQPGDCDGYPETAFNQHWSYYFNSRSLMYGSFIDDLGGGKFKLYYEKPKYSPLDQYLMGLRKPEEVGPLFLVQVQDFTMGSSSIPIQPGKSSEIEGARLDFTVDDIIRAEGPRQPPSDICHWKAAVILVTEKGKPPSPKVLDKLVTYANRWEEFYSWATDGRGSMDLTIDGSGAGNDLCPAPSKPPPADGTVADTAEAVLPPEEFPDGPRDPGGQAEEVTQAEDEPDIPVAWDFGPYPDAGPLDVIAEVSDRPDSGGTVQTDGGKMCTPDESICQGTWVSRCLPDGSGWVAAENCETKGLACLKGACAAKDSGVGKPSGCAAGSRGVSAVGSMAVVFLALGLFLRRRRLGE